MSLLVRHPETKDLLVNFDPAVTQLIRETDCMVKMEMEVPEAAKLVFQRQEKLKEHQDKLKVNHK